MRSLATPFIHLNRKITKFRVKIREARIAALSPQLFPVISGGDHCFDGSLGIGEDDGGNGTFARIGMELRGWG